MLNIEKKLDKAFQALSVNKKCFYCDNHASEIHHLVRRSYALYRWDKRNALPICRQHHFDIHSNGLKEPEIPFEQEDIRVYLTRNFISYWQFLELKAKEYGIKYTDKDFEKVKSVFRKNRKPQKPVCSKMALTENPIYKKVMEFKRKQRKEAYSRHQEIGLTNKLHRV